MRVEPLQAIAFVLGGVTTLVAFAWRYLHVPTTRRTA